MTNRRAPALRAVSSAWRSPPSGAVATASVTVGASPAFASGVGLDAGGAAAGLAAAAAVVDDPGTGRGSSAGDGTRQLEHRQSAAKSVPAPRTNATSEMNGRGMLRPYPLSVIIDGSGGRIR